MRLALFVELLMNGGVKRNAGKSTIGGGKSAFETGSVGTGEEVVAVQPAVEEAEDGELMVVRRAIERILCSSLLSGISSECTQAE